MTAMQQALLDANIVSPTEVDAAEKIRQVESKKCTEQRAKVEEATAVVSDALPKRVVPEFFAVLEKYPTLFTEELYLGWAKSIFKQQNAEERQTRMLALWSRFLFDNQLVCLPA